ncbi:uncharacterized protein TNCV_4090091 [Trichonephila clavipes]|uniref:Uncharacterized protein n=1 Tax=Trichonephila clavipes TaxID=2585209 RepID=A0A8X6V6Q6_TRICX|nr:uncharacterized protein TNCV_4090091 [Trichonephila clavipes]
MCGMILITPSQRDYLRILWKSDKNDLVSTYILNAATYGTTSAPFLAARTLTYIAIENREKFPVAAEILEIDFYVNDLVLGGSSGNKGVQRFVLIENYKSLELHGFSDASEKAFGTFIYLRCTNSSEQLLMRLLCSNSRIAPIKRISIPRLELCAAGLLSRLVKKVIASLKLEFDGVYFWIDSTIVLE